MLYIEISYQPDQNSRYKRRMKKTGLKLSIQKTKVMASGPINSQQIEGEKSGNWHILFSWALKSLWTVTAAMKLKDTLLLRRKAMRNLDSVLKSKDI